MFELAFWLQSNLKMGFLSTYNCLNFIMSLYFFIYCFSKNTTIAKNIPIVSEKQIFVCKHLANFSDQLSNLKSDPWPKLVIEIVSKNQPQNVLFYYTKIFQRSCMPALPKPVSSQPSGVISPPSTKALLEE